jgi:hypothetical protein
MSSATVNQSAVRYGAVTKSDTTVLSFKGLYIGGTGAVAVKNGPDGTVVTFSALPAGARLDVTGTHVMAATTATNVVWLDW